MVGAAFCLRRGQMCIRDRIQTVITTTNLGYFADDMLARARVIRIGDV